MTDMSAGTLSAAVRKASCAGSTAYRRKAPSRYTAPTSSPVSFSQQQEYISPPMPLSVSAQLSMLSPALYSTDRPVSTPIR